MISLPLIAASCGGTKKENPKPENPELKEVQDSLNNVTVDVADKNKLASTVQKTDVTVGTVTGFTFTVESVTGNDTTGELTVVVKSTKGQTSATKEFKISGFMKKDADQQPKETEEQKLRREVSFTYNGTITEGSTPQNFKDNIRLSENSNFVIDPGATIIVKIKTEASSVPPTVKKYALIKLTLKKESKSLDFYVKFALNTANVMGIKTNKEEFDSIKNQEQQPMPKPEPKLEDKLKSVKYSFKGTITKTSDFSKEKITIVDASEFTLDLENSISTIKGNEILVKLVVKHGNVKFADVYVKFVVDAKTENPQVSALANSDEFDAALKEELKAKLAMAKYSFKGTITKTSDFSKEKITIVDAPEFTLDLENSISTIKGNEILVKLVVKHGNVKFADVYVKFVVDANPQVSALANSDEFDAALKEELKAKLAMAKYSFKGTITKTSDFRKRNISIIDAPGFSLDLANSISTIKGNEILVKLVVKYGNVKFADVYVKFVVDAKTENPQVSALANSDEFTNELKAKLAMAKYSFKGTITKTSDFRKRNISIIDAPGFSLDLANSISTIKGNEILVKLVVKYVYEKIADVYVKFVVDAKTENPQVSALANSDEFTNELKAKLAMAKYSFKGTITKTSDFSKEKITIVDAPGFSLDLTNSISKIKGNEILVKLVVKYVYEKIADVYVKFVVDAKTENPQVSALADSKEFDSINN
ncbi:hypothetical protein JV176_02530 [Mycoplasma sp. CSL 7498]|nr:hypothetical protein [Mycoplasma phocoeninasale]